MEPATTLRFATAARVLGQEARARGLAAPGFRSPPRIPDANRTLRRRPHGASVAVRLRGRPWATVLADMIEGVVAANDVAVAECDTLRAALWEAVGEALASRSVTKEARVA